ncbi:DUF732 domain-containing protein [Mycobacterium heidelbergense]|uniref:DUF732 domain-containing protein n=1 Tax=Mycobacterium heidelbergense TaxID=53376 RepID=UPI003CFA4E7F
MRLLLALLGVPTAIALAAPAFGDPGGVDDVSFLATVRGAGINYTSPDQAIASAKAACGWIGTGKSGPELVGDLQRSNPALTTTHASVFLAIAAKYYCPQQLSAGDVAR